MYRKYELTPSQPISTVSFLFFVPLISSASLVYHVTFEHAAVLSFSLFYAALCASVVAYRLSPWHPLAKYPGPFLAKISQLWFAQKTTTGKWSVILKELHDEYGTYVRIGERQSHRFMTASITAGCKVRTSYPSSMRVSSPSLWVPMGCRKGLVGYLAFLVSKLS